MRDIEDINEVMKFLDLGFFLYRSDEDGTCLLIHDTESSSWHEGYVPSNIRKEIQDMTTKYCERLVMTRFSRPEYCLVSITNEVSIKYEVEIKYKNRPNDEIEV